jgi:hypothetical protein
VAVQEAHEVAEAGIAGGEIVQRRIGGVAAVAVRLRPGDAGAVLLRELAAGVFQLGEQGGIAEVGLVEEGGEEGAGAGDCVSPRQRMRRCLSLGEKG